MADLDLQNVPILHLLIELLKDGKAEIIDDLARFEPIDIDALEQTLCHRTGMAFGVDFQSWLNWYLSDESQATEWERQTLSMMKTMVERQKHFESRLLRRRSAGKDNEKKD